MADNIQTTIDKELQDSLAALAHKHVTISYTVIALLVLVLALGSVGAYLGAKWVDKAIARAEAAEVLMLQYDAQYKTLQQTYQKELADHAADRAAAAQKEAELIAALTARNKQADGKISDVLKPGKSAEQAMSDLQDAYKNMSRLKLTLSVSKDPQTGEQLMAFPVPVVQQFTATKIDRDRLADNLSNTQQQLDLEKGSNASLIKDLTNLQTAHAALQKSNDQCKTALDDYKKVVAPSKFKKIIGGAIKVGIFLGGIVIGKHI